MPIMHLWHNVFVDTINKYYRMIRDYVDTFLPYMYIITFIILTFVVFFEKRVIKNVNMGLSHFFILLNNKIIIISTHPDELA